jgi:leucyl/phenylalanyl-tRNA---protein transferase
LALTILTKRLWFPPAEKADRDGLLAVGGDLSRERLLLAYRNGIFPWYNEGEPPLWWCPNPRFVLLPEKIKVSNSMKQVLKSGKFEFSTNRNFESVIHNCRTVRRNGQDGTWITAAVLNAYIDLHRAGHAHSAEAYADGVLVGGLYGVRMGNVFFGESMFSLLPNASKFAFITYCRQLLGEGVKLIDCQVYTEHLERLGAEKMPRSTFLELLQAEIP